jgi:signal transduction histidine kinase
LEITPTPIQTGESILRPKARLIKTIGEELISNDVVAIIELVKNSYDANSPISVIKFQGNIEIVKEGRTLTRVLKKEGATIEILDEGEGMSLTIIESAWMEPATTFKKNSKNTNPKRRFTGEKGIGRFASAKLANNLEIITKQENDNEIVIAFNWNDFNDDTKYLADVKSKWEVRKPIVINNKGTILNLNNLTIDWDENKFRDLRIALSRLLSPLAPTEDFLIELQLPTELEDLNGLIERPETLNRPDYLIRGSISEDGTPELFYFSKKEGKEKKVNIKKEEFKLRDPLRESLSGPFSFEFRVWNRDTDSIRNLAKEINSTTKNIRKDLDDLAGISIYRDNFRVLPYGNKNDDWLRLDIRRVNNPTVRLSNNQIVGYVSVSLDKNPDLTDQSNREGIIESRAFTDLKSYIILLLNEVEIRRYAERPRESDSLENKEGLFQRFSLQSVTEYIKEKIPNNKEVLEVVQKKDSEIQEGIKKVQEVIARYRRLTTLGQLIDVILHDGGNYLGKIDAQANLIEKELLKTGSDLEKIKQYVYKIHSVRKDFAQMFKRIAPFGGRKRGRPKVVIVEEIIENQFLLAHYEIEKLNIKYSLPNSKNTVTIDEAELGIIIMNLLQNAVHWLETVDNERRIVVQVIREQDNLSIIFSDNGPGVREDFQKLIFDPYFSTRPDGIGLGLTIVGELVSEYNGDFVLINNGPLDGATFKITFKYRI